MLLCMDHNHSRHAHCPMGVGTDITCRTKQPVLSSFSIHELHTSSTFCSRSWPWCSGYGCSTGVPSVSNTKLDIDACYAWLQSKGCSPNHVILYALDPTCKP